MGIFSGTKKVASVLFNFKVKDWVDYDNIKRNSKFIANSAKDVFTPESAEHTETFEEAIKRQNITEEDLKERVKLMSRYLLLFLTLSGLIFAYSIYLAVMGNVLGFCIGFSLTIFSCTQAFKYHFWIFQIRKRKLGCTLNEWLDGN